MVSYEMSETDSKEVRYRFAINGSNELVNIRDVDKTKCRYSFFCPCCKNVMVAATGEERVHYFRHKGEQPSTCNYDNYLHSLAKEVFFREYNKCLNDRMPFILSALLPIKCNNAYVLKRHADCPQRYVRQEIDLTKFFNKEPKIEAAIKVSGLGDRTIRRPDILLETEGGEQLWVEIWVNHASCEEKKKEGSVLEIKIQSENELDQFYNHRIEESQDGEEKVTLSNKTLFERIGFLCDESAGIGRMLCEDKCIYKNYPDKHEGHLSSSRNSDFLKTTEPNRKGLTAEEDDKNALLVLDGLNNQQKMAVRTVNGPLLIVAGAGSGKTKVLTSRVAYMLAKGVDPTRVLALTFTKKAAMEMKERIALLVGRRARAVVMGTFHSVFVRFLRDYATSIGYPGNFTIYDRSDSESAVKTCVKELKLNDKKYKAREILSRISFAKNGLYTPEAYHSNAEMQQQDLHGERPFLWKVYQLYQEKLKQNGVMDFDDILLNMNILLRDNAEARREISSRFDYILVDEYQDTNYSQYLILKKLAAPHHNLCVVGDDSQSIYAFRGAQIQNILNFQKDYPESMIIRLERNYRSTRNIVDAANSVIAHNEDRIPKKCFSEGEAGDKIEFIKSFTEQEEAVQIVSGIISRVMNEKAQYRDFAILYRTNSQSRALEEALRRRNIPYMIYSGNSFFERAEIKDMMAWFKLCVNINDDESFKRAIGKPSRGIGDTSLAGLNELRRVHGISSLFEAAYCDDYLEFLRPSAMLKIRSFCDLVRKLALVAATEDAYDVARQIYEGSSLYEYYKTDDSFEGMARVANLDELLNSVQTFKEERLDDILSDMDSPPDYNADNENLPTVYLSDFLETTSLISNADTTDDDESGSNKVALMTVHSAKGLEFPYVYIAGAEENLFPSGGMMASPTDVEEERRLFYVALTRAKKAVSVSFASTRMRNGKHESNSPSRFVKEIDPAYVSNPLPAGGFDDEEDDDDSGMPFWFRNRNKKTTGYTNSSSGSPWSPSNYGRSGQVQSFRRSQQTASTGVFRSSSHAHAKPSPMPSRVVTPPAKPAVIDPDFVPVPMTQLFEGERIEHNRFGGGTILSITGIPPEMKAEIDFDAYGKKLLLLKYAKLRPEKK